MSQHEYSIFVIETDDCNSCPVASHDNPDRQAHEELHDRVTNDRRYSLLLSG